METEPPLMTLHGKIAGIDGLVRNAMVVAEGETALRLIGVQELAVDALAIIEHLRAAASDGARQPQGLDLEPIKAREAAATKGPWEYQRLSIHERARTVDSPTETHDVVDADVAGGDAFERHGRYVCGFASTRGKYEREEANGLFVAHARNDIPLLIAEVERLRAAASDDGAARREDAKARGYQRAYERLELCSDHRDKANGRCIVCQAEERTRAELRADDEAARPQPAQDPTSK